MCDKAYWKCNASFLKSENKLYNNFIDQNNALDAETFYRMVNVLILSI